jgi:hypothetical protein
LHPTLVSIDLQVLCVEGKDSEASDDFFMEDVEPSLSDLDHDEHDSDAGNPGDFPDLLESDDDVIEQPVTGVGDVEARRKVLQDLLRKQDSRKSLASDGPYHFSSKGLLFVVAYVTNYGPFTHKQLTGLIALLGDEDVKRLDLSMVDGRSLLELAARKTPSIPLEKVESTKTTIKRRKALDGTNEGDKIKRKNVSVESRTTRTKVNTLYASPLLYLTRVMNNSVQEATLLPGLQLAGEDGVQTFNQTPLAHNYRKYSEHQFASTHGQEVNLGDFIYLTNDKSVLYRHMARTHKIAPGRTFIESKSLCSVTFLSIKFVNTFVRTERRKSPRKQTRPQAVPQTVHVPMHARGVVAHLLTILTSDESYSPNGLSIALAFRCGCPIRLRSSS